MRDCMPGAWRDGRLSVNQGKEHFDVRCDGAGLARVVAHLERTDRRHLSYDELQRIVQGRVRDRRRPCPS